MTKPRVTALLLNEKDNVICLLRDHRAGERPVLDGCEGPPLGTDIALGHKVARQAIANGSDVVKYGAVIGHATDDIGAGDHVHLHNLEGLRAAGDEP